MLAAVLTGVRPSWTMIGLPEATPLKETDSASFRSVRSSLAVGPYPRVRTWSGLVLCGLEAACYSCCELLSVEVMSRTEDTFATVFFDLWHL